MSVSVARLPMAHPPLLSNCQASLLPKNFRPRKYSPIAIDVLNQHVIRWILDGDTLVLVRDFNVMDPHVETPDVDAIETAHVRTSDNDIIDFSVGARVDDQMESGGVHKANIVDAELVHID